jgi:hypothetical protein
MSKYCVDKLILTYFFRGKKFLKRMLINSEHINSGFVVEVKRQAGVEEKNPP